MATDASSSSSDGKTLWGQPIDTSDELASSYTTIAETPSTSSLASILDTTDDIPSFLNSLLTPSSPSSHIPALRDPLALTNVDKSVSSLLSSLHILSQDTSSHLERSIQDVTRTIPRLTYDLQFMRESAENVKGSLRTVQSRVRGGKGEISEEEERDGSEHVHGSVTPTLTLTNPTNSNGDQHDGYTPSSQSTHPDLQRQVLQRLTYLDTLKTRMEDARDVLLEAESWSTLESETITFLSEGRYADAGKRLFEAANSLKVFQKTPAEWESRKALLVSLQDELEQRLASVLREKLVTVETEGERGVNKGEGKNEAMPAEKEEMTVASDDAENGDTQVQAPLTLPRIHGIFRLIERQDEFKNVYFATRRAELEKTWTDVATATTATQAQPFSHFLNSFFGQFLDLLTNEAKVMPTIFSPAQPLEILVSFLHTTLETLNPSFSLRLEQVADYLRDQALPELLACWEVTESFGKQVEALLEALLISSPPVVPPPPQTPSTPSHSRRPSRRFSRSLGGNVSFDPSSLSLGVALTPAQIVPTWDLVLYEPFLDYQSDYSSWEKRYLFSLLHRSGSPKSSMSERMQYTLHLAEDAIARCSVFTHNYAIPGLIDALDHFIAESIHQASSTSEKESAEQDRNVSSSVTGDELDDLAGGQALPIQSGLAVLQSCRNYRQALDSLIEKLKKAVEQGQSPGVTPGSTTLFLQSALNNLELQRPIIALERSRASLSMFFSDAQKDLQQTILAPIQDLLVHYPSLSIWSKPDKPVRRGELSIPTFSLSPTDIISQVAESLLNLLRIFELYSGEDALAFSLETLPYVDQESLQALLQESTMGPELVVSTWVSSLTICLLAYLTVSVLPSFRPPLTNSGAAQLATDLGYLSNAVKALDVEWEELETWREAADCKTSEEMKGKNGEIYRMVAALRGW